MTDRREPGVWRACGRERHSFGQGRESVNLPLKAVATSRLELVSMETPSLPWEIADPVPARSRRRCSKSEATSPLPTADGAYTAPISPETREHATERVGTQRDQNPMDTRVSAIAGNRAGSLGMGFRELAVKGSGVRIPSAPPESQPLKPLLRQGFQRVWGCSQGESGRVLSVESPRQSAGIWRRGAVRWPRRCPQVGARRCPG